VHICIVCSDEVLIKSTTSVVAVRTTIVSFGHGCWFFGEKTCLVRLFALCRKILFNTSCHFKIGMHFILTLFYFSILVFGLFFFKLVFTVIVQGHISRGNYVPWTICWFSVQIQLTNLSQASTLFNQGASHNNDPNHKYSQLLLYLKFIEITYYCHTNDFNDWP
jgi:hypothetical protein